MKGGLFGYAATPVGWWLNGWLAKAGSRGAGWGETARGRTNRCPPSAVSKKNQPTDSCHILWMQYFDLGNAITMHAMKYNPLLSVQCWGFFLIIDHNFEGFNGCSIIFYLLKTTCNVIINQRIPINHTLNNVVYK